MIEERPKSAAEQDIENKMEHIDDESLRYAVLEKARTFKSGWVELGETLAQIAKAKTYDEWGFKTLEAYCLKELHIRKATVAKLIGNYYFLSRNEPEMLKKEQLTKLPDFNTMDVLAKAKENNIDQETYQQLKTGAIEKGFSAATINRKLKESQGGEQPAPEERLKKKIRSLASSIRLLFMEEGSVPNEINMALDKIENFISSSNE